MEDEPWASYQRLQSLLASTTNQHRAAGIEAALTDLLTKIERGECIIPEQVDYLVINRIGRERRRRAMLYSRERELVRVVASERIPEIRLTLEECAAVCGRRDFDLLVLRARGHSYGELAKATGVNQNTLKVRVHRARRRLDSWRRKG